MLHSRIAACPYHKSLRRLQYSSAEWCGFFGWPSHNLAMLLLLLCLREQLQLVGSLQARVKQLLLAGLGGIGMQLQFLLNMLCKVCSAALHIGCTCRSASCAAHMHWQSG